MLSKVLAVDPGVTSGVATRIDGVYTTIEMQDYRGVWMFAKNMLPWDLVLCENFTAVHISKYGLHTVRVIGGMEHFCFEHNIPYMTLQNVRRIRYKKQAVSIMGKKGPHDHMMDALAHLLCWQYEIEGKS